MAVFGFVRNLCFLGFVQNYANCAQLCDKLDFPKAHNSKRKWRVVLLVRQRSADSNLLCGVCCISFSVHCWSWTAPCTITCSKQVCTCTQCRGGTHRLPHTHTQQHAAEMPGSRGLRFWWLVLGQRQRQRRRRRKWEWEIGSIGTRARVQANVGSAIRTRPRTKLLSEEALRSGCTMRQLEAFPRHVRALKLTAISVSGTTAIKTMAYFRAWTPATLAPSSPLP